MDAKTLISKIKFDPTISLGHIGATVLFITGVAGSWYMLDKNVAIQAEKITQIEKLGTELKSEIRSNREEIRIEMKTNREEIRQDIRDLRTEIKQNEFTRPQRY